MADEPGHPVRMTTAEGVETIFPVVINPEVFGKSAAMATVADRLDELVDVSRVRLVDATRAGTPSSRRRFAQGLSTRRWRRCAASAFRMQTSRTRAEVVGSLATGPAEASLVWADVIGTAWLNARPIALPGVHVRRGGDRRLRRDRRNSILIVGAMAVSPTCSRSPRSESASSRVGLDSRARPS